MLAQAIPIPDSGEAALPRGADVAVLVNRAARGGGRTGCEPAVRKILSLRLRPEFFYPASTDEMAAAARTAARAGAVHVAVLKRRGR